MPTTAAIGNALRIQDCSPGLKPRLGRYPKISGNQAPQIKNSNTIIRKSLNRGELFITSAAKIGILMHAGKRREIGVK